MKDIRTYAIGNGEITLTAQDAEELRIMLQTEHLKKVVTELIDQRADCFSFSSDSSRRHFIDEIVRINYDFIEYDSSYHTEILLENIFLRADALGIGR